MALPSSFRTPVLRLVAASVATIPALHAAPAAASPSDAVAHAAAVHLVNSRTADAPSGAWPGALTRSGGGPVAFDVALATDAAATGMSGALRARIVMPGEELDLAFDWGPVRPTDAWYQWVPAHGSTAAPPPERSLRDGEPVYAPAAAGTWSLAVGWDGGARMLDQVVLLVREPAAALREGRLNGYRIGGYPAGGGRYAPPAGFIEVTPANRDVYVSRSFQLRQFLTKDQPDVWPKYVLIDPLLLDKLELVLADVRAQGIRADRMFVMSGYRTPHYNVQGIGQGSLSRHQYGDAADVWIENDDSPGMMADLNGDGRVDEEDARVMLRAMERVEAKHPALIGGGGVYRANAAHGPFLHIDVRGTRARW